jgi:hypothetical protein
MNLPQFPLISASECSDLYEALHFCKMKELQHVCKVLALDHSGIKSELISRIMTFIETGEKLKKQVMPSVSLAKFHPSQPLSNNSLMLFGGYKNDLVTRNFFKSLIGQHFHYTAFGIDWLNERWHAGNPPTHQEFAQYWIDETEKRNHKKAQPKGEWAFIKFVQRIKNEHPEASRIEIMDAWKMVQAQNVARVHTIIKNVISKLKTGF